MKVSMMAARSAHAENPQTSADAFRKKLLAQIRHAG
ncbi:hypothetical protein QO004_001785 [Rhizobium mesoamericanum]|nr:hypothetical protein [Rhizobium mesoamericanum]